MKIEKNKTYEFSLKGQVSFGSVSENRVYELLQDGRLASFFLEEQLQHWFPELTRIEGNKDHDHVDLLENKYDAKNFTKASGLSFKPSNQMGAGRKFVAEVAHEKALNLCYICCDIVEFPRVRVKFVDGADLINEYPKCEIPKGHREVLFG